MNKKVSIILILVLAIIGIVVWFVFKDNVVKESDQVDYLILGNNTLWEKKNDTWRSLDSDKLDKDINYTVYVDNFYKGIYQIDYINTWNVYTADSNLFYEGNLLAYSNKLIKDVKNYDVDVLSLSDVNYLNDILSKNYTIDDFTYQEKVSVDLNNDGINDYIIVANNFDIEGANNYFSIIYTVINGVNNIILNKNIEVEKVHYEPSYAIYAIFNIDGAKGSNIIFRRTYYSMVRNTGYSMYQNNDGKYDLVIAD